jgi:hypothetical protein
MLAGCGGPKNVTVTGSILRGGKPLPLSKTGVVQVTLMPDVGPDQEYTTYVGRCESDGSFKIDDVPPGRYKIGIEHLDPTPQDDQLRGAMRAENSKIIREIDGKAPLVIDLTKPGG